MDNQTLQEIRPRDIRTISLAVQNVANNQIDLTIAETTIPYVQSARKGNVLQFRTGYRDLFTVRIEDIPTLIAIFKSFDSKRELRDEHDRRYRRTASFKSTHEDTTTSVIISETQLHYESYSARDVLEISTSREYNAILFTVPRSFIEPLAIILRGFT